MAEVIAELIVHGTVLARDLPLELTTDAHDPDGTRWHGRFQVPSATTLALGDRCVLRLADGRRGEAEVTRLGYGRASEAIRVFFRGRSPLS